jgi:TonB family protein
VRGAVAMRTGSSALPVLLAGVLLTLTAAGGHAQCLPAKYQVAQVFSSSGDPGAQVSVSTTLDAFTPRGVVCLASELRGRFREYDPLYVLIFSSPISAKYWRPWAADVNATENLVQGRHHSKDLHAIYTYDSNKHQEYVDVKTIGSDLASPTDLRISMPVADPPPCRIQVTNRCLLAADSLRYPREPANRSATGTVLLRGTITPDGRVINVRRLSAASSPAGSEEALVNAAIAHLKTWRLQPGRSVQSLTITYRFVLDSTIPEGFDDVTMIGSDEVRIGMNPAPRARQHER